MRMMTDIQCFLASHKPALLVSKVMPYYEQSEIEQIHKYPHVSVIQQQRESTLYFQNEELKERFIQKTKIIGADHKSPEFFYYLGIALGYAPKAVAYYVNKHVKQIQSTSVEIAYDYNGIQFASCADNLLYDVIWLWDQYTMENMVIYYHKRWSLLQRGDYKQLLKIREEIEKGAALATP